MQMILKQPICLRKSPFRIILCRVQINSGSMTQLVLSKLGVLIKTTVSATVLEEALNCAVTGSSTSAWSIFA
ncbi:hypothetical protein AQUCO_07200030v1 [Aquilegia coerulea]|uniref:Uncharacterized protein n=1 Tax=Aquilegia coerulea TaxID=218851 RepID=A0A2G5CA07_AQUCA|nr:hypothetical protein AQUCO_07200030v1 [Aquilegia coerulea]